MSIWTKRLSYSLVASKVRIPNLLFHTWCLTYCPIVCEDPQVASDKKTEDLEFENDQLRSRIIALERELNCQSPSRKPRTRNALETSRNSNLLGRESDIESALLRMDQLKLTDNMFPPAATAAGSPGKKPRKMATRKWDLAPEDEI